MVREGRELESDIRFYRRRACEEMNAANRAVTPAARQRRLQLVDLYVEHLKALQEPSPFEHEHPSRSSASRREVELLS